MIRQNRYQPGTLLIIGFAVATISIVSAATTTPQTTQTTAKATTSSSTAPTGVFTLQPQGYGFDAYDEIDQYLPYRSDEHDRFSIDFLKAVLQEEQSNVVISPFSVQLVLALLSEAAGNNTQTQIELLSTLASIKSRDNLRGFYKKILTSLKKENPHYTLNLETKIYTDAFVKPEQRYASTLSTFYDTDIECLEFADSRNSADAINEWCSNVTQGRLQQLVNEDNIRNNVLLMVNVIYFKGLWRRQFNETYQGVFFRTPTQQLKVDYMEQTEYFYSYDSNEMDAKILRLPYKGKKFSMFIVLPKTKGGVDELIASLDSTSIKRMQWMMEESKIKVTMPKFKFELKKNLKDTLRNLGINDIFTNEASLPGLARGAEVAGKLKVSNVFQKAGIDVNELGTEAFASTVIEIENKFGGSIIIEEFNVNRPFLFFIEEESTGNILFAGKVLEPFV